MTNATVRLKPGDRLSVVAQDPNLKPDNTLPPWGEAPVDPGYGFPLRPKPVDPAYGVDEGTGPVRPTHPIVIVPSPPPGGGPGIPVDPGYGVDEGTGPLYPTHPIALPPTVAPPTTPDGTPIEWKIAFIPAPGPGWVVYGVPTGAHVTPSKKK